MHAGMYAAEAIVESLKEDIDSVNFESYDEKIRDSVIEKDLYRSRNMKQPLTKGLIVGGIVGNAMVATKGDFPRRPLEGRGQRRARRCIIGNAARAGTPSPTTS